MKNILGINGGVRIGNQDAASVLISDGKIIACAEEERFIRIKHAPGYLPENAITFCLKYAGLNIKDIDYVVFAGATYDSMTEILRNFFEFKFGYSPKIILIDHHLAHASSAFYLSGFEDSFIITADLSGDNKSTVLWYADSSGIREIESYKKPNSLGLFYAAITQYLGFKYDNDECKTMALSALTSKTNCIINDFLNIGKKKYNLNTGFLDDRIMPGKSNPARQEPLFNKKFIDLIGKKPRSSKDDIDEFYLSVAHSAQLSLENAYFMLTDKIKKNIEKSNNLCLSGGVALNAELNSKLAYSGKFKNLFVQPVAGDAGLSLGGALYAAFKYNSLSQSHLSDLYYGPKYNDENIKKVLDRVKVKYKYYNKDIVSVIAKNLAGGKIGAVFNGRMEYGARALGNRSILASPNNIKVKNILNKEFKQRESFQPFAPSVLDKYAYQYFDFPSDTNANFDFMVINARVRENKKSDIIAAIHVNNTARVQIVRKNINPDYYNIIEQFGKITGINVLLNTSLNRKGQPICCTPEDALSVFFTVPLDFITIGNCLIEK